MVRFTTSLIALFAPEIRSFVPSELEAAFEFLGMTREERTSVFEVLDGQGESLAILREITSSRTAAGKRGRP